MKRRPYIDPETETRETMKEIIGKKIVHAYIVTDKDPRSRGIGCASRDYLTLIFSDGTVAEFRITGDFGLSVRKDVTVSLECGMNYPKG